MHILCGVNESAGGQAAAHVAALVAHRMGADLTLVHVVPMPAAPASVHRAPATLPVDFSATGTAVLSAERELDALADEIAAAFDARPDVCVVQGDNPAAQLQAAARERASDLIIIGAAPRTRFASALYAGTGEALVQKADCPVMVVPPGAAPPTDNRVAVTYDTSGASESAAAVAARLASALKGSLTVIHVLPDPRSYTRPVLPMHDDVRSVVEAALDGEELDLRHVFAYRLPAVHLAQTVAQLQPAFLAVAAPKRGWRSLFRPSIGARLLRSASCPVVVVPDGVAARSKATTVAAPA
jgi:nucleotide-binding universal stress UspA family protein